MYFRDKLLGGKSMYKILVPIDGSEYSKKAMLKAKELATALEAEITLLNVSNPLKDTKYMHNKQYFQEIRRNSVWESEGLLDEAMESFKDFTGKVSAVHKMGDVVEEIVKFAENEGYNLVVMGSRGAGVFSRTLLGSVSDSVIHHIKTSVLIVK